MVEKTGLNGTVSIPPSCMYTSLNRYKHNTLFRARITVDDGWVCVLMQWKKSALIAESDIGHFLTIYIYNVQ